MRRDFQPNFESKTPAFGQTDRRVFLKITGLGLVAVFTATGRLSAILEAQDEGPPPYPKDFNAYLHIETNGRVTGYVGRVELGQGTKTSLAQCIAEELDVPFDKVDMVMGDTDLCPWDMGTFGSLSFNLFQSILRGASAEARAVLLQMASEKLQVPVAQLQVKNGVVSVIGAPAKSITYAKLVDGKRIEHHIEKVPLKPVSAFKVLGTSPQRTDTLDKITGKAKYAADLGLPGTVYARLVRPPAHGATLKSADTSGAEKLGAKIVRDGDFIAVVHQRPDLAENALAAVKSDWELPQTDLDDQTIFAHLQKFAPQLQLVSEKGNLAESEKLIAASIESSQKGAILEQTYLNSYVYHAPLETHSVVAKFDGGKLTIWASTQIPFITKDVATKVLGLSPENVRIIVPPYVGGGFGGKSDGMQESLEAGRLAKMLGDGKPVQIVWSRAEDMFYNQHRPAAVVNIRSGLTSEGKLDLWEYKVFGAGDWGAETTYDIPNQRTSWVGHWASFKPTPKGMQPLPVGPWRAPAANTNNYANESQIDQMALKAGMDPAEFRLKHLMTDMRQKRVLEAALKQFGYKPAGRSPSGRGIGMAVGKLYNTYAAALVQVEVDKNTGAVQVKRVVEAVDAGVIANPEGARQQVEGCITMGIGSALSEEVHFKNGEVLDHNFDSYEIPYFSSIPKMEIVLVENTELPPLGLAEPPTVPIGPAIANAIFDAVGARVLQLPMTPVRVKEALSKA